jgi:hypothetical protein
VAIGISQVSPQSRRRGKCAVVSIGRFLVRHLGVSINKEGNPMRYSLLMHYEDAEAAGITEEDMEPARAAFDAYASSLDEAGVLVSAEVLQPRATTTTVTMQGGSLKIQDGPFADSKEQFAGGFVIDVPDLDAALAWAEKCPGAQFGTVEVRPSEVYYSDGSWRSAT